MGGNIDVKGAAVAWDSGSSWKNINVSQLLPQSQTGPDEKYAKEQLRTK